MPARDNYGSVSLNDGERHQYPPGGTSAGRNQIDKRCVWITVPPSRGEALRGNDNGERTSRRFGSMAKNRCRNWPRGVVERAYVKLYWMPTPGQARGWHPTPQPFPLDSPLSTLHSQKWVLSRMTTTGQSKPRYEIHWRCAKATGKQGVFEIFERDKIRGYVPSNRVCHFVVKTIKTQQTGLVVAEGSEWKHRRGGGMQPLCGPRTVESYASPIAGERVARAYRQP